MQPLRAEPEDIPLDIVFEDAHVLVVNKPPHMVIPYLYYPISGVSVLTILHEEIIDRLCPISWCMMISIIPVVRFYLSLVFIFTLDKNYVRHFR